MKPVIILRGIPGTGKTSTALLLRERLQPAIRLSVDSFRYLVHPKELNQVQLEAAKISVSRVAVEYCKRDMTAVIESVFESESMLKTVLDVFRENSVPHFVFTLCAAKDEIIDRNFSRESFYHQPEERINTLFASYNFDVGVRIDTNDKIIEEVVDNICIHLKG